MLRVETAKTSAALGSAARAVTMTWGVLAKVEGNVTVNCASWVPLVPSVAVPAWIAPIVVPVVVALPTRTVPTTSSFTEGEEVPMPTLAVPSPSTTELLSETWAFDPIAVALFS